METVIIGGLLKEVTTALGGFAYNEIAKVMGVKHEIKKLERRLKTINDELRAADHTIIAHAEANHELLKQLTEIAYEAESIIDRFKIEVGTSQIQERSGSLLCRCCREVNTRSSAAKRLEKLNKRLDDMRASNELRLVLRALAPSMYQRPESSSEVIGPSHAELNNSVGSIISNDCNDPVRWIWGNSSKSISLFAIVGAPGVGKTALAQKIYKMRGNPKFKSKMWVHISSSTGKMTIWLDEKLDDKASNSEPVQQKQIIRSRFLTWSDLLVVIDNVRDKEGWEFLGELAEGLLKRNVKVILTASHRDRTRKIGVDRWFGCHHVRALDEDDGWLLLRTTAQLREREAVGNIQDAGIRIVSKCSGLPLALKAVGSSLRQQDQLGPWMAELSADFFVTQREIQRSIDTSYMELGYRLKLCFLYCSLYPEGSVIQQKIIMQQWIAEGFFQGGSSRTTEEQQGTFPEEVEARECYKELVDRSLLLPAGDGCATMPNLLRSYAIYRSRDENYVIGAGDPRNIGREFKVWRLYAADGDKILDIPDDVTSLRTLLVFGSSSPRGDTSTNATPPLMNTICKRFTNLRVLDLRDGQVESVGDNLGQLLQLRYLNLSNTSIKTLPQEVGNLVMLQYLILNNCRRLTSLPRGVGCLKNLRTLDISETPGLQVQHIHFSFRSLKELNCFRGFLPARVISSKGWTFEELSNLTKLTSLQILNLGSGTSSQEAAQLRLHEMSHLKELELFCTIPADHGHPPGGDVDSIGDVLGELKPPEHLTSLKLAKFYGDELPPWVSSSHLTSLEQLTLDGCTQCQQLPPSLGDMMNLNFLKISGCSALCEISHEFRGSPVNLVAFPRLEQLIVAEMESLQTWSAPAGDDPGLLEKDMPLLRSFHVSRCPRLSALPPWLQQLKALTSMKIQVADKLLEIRGLPALKELQVDSCRALQRISELSRLEDLEITACPGLVAVEGVPQLRSLRLREDASSKELPLWLPRLAPVSRLRRLEILGGEDLLDSFSSEHAPSWPRIKIKGIAYLVHAKVVHDGSAYFSCWITTTSPPRFHMSKRWRDRAKAYDATVQTLLPPPQENKAWWWRLICGYTPLLREKGGNPQEARAWMWRALYGVVAAFLIGSTVILSTGGTRPSANGTIAA